LILLITAAVTPCSAQINVQIVNNSAVYDKKSENYLRIPDEDVYLLLTGDNASATGITPNVSTQLSALTSSEFTLNSISSGRITFSFNGAVPANQQPLDSSDRFDKVELTYTGLPGDAANLTAVDFFGIPFKLETLDGSGNVLQKLTYYTSANSLESKLEALAAPAALITTNGITGGPFARILSPSLSPSSYSSMQSYVTSVAGKTVHINGTYVGPVGPSPNTYSYSGTFGKSHSSITLSGTQSANPSPEMLTIDGSTLASAIYTDNGAYTVGGNPAQVSDNDVYAAIYRDLVAGFDFGYVHGKYGNNSAGWYGTTPYHPPYACARTTHDGFYNKYAAIIAASSDAYGFPFSDRNQPVQVALNSAVATLRITLLPDNVLDAPIIQSTTPGAHSLKVKWASVSGATDYTVNVSPPIPAQTFDAGDSTSYRITSLNPGTPYTVSVTASNATSTSEAIPVVVSTQHSVSPISGPVGWHFIAFFTGTFSGDKITFNGETKTLPGSPNPSLSWNSVTGVPGQTNAYVFDWKDAKGRQIYKSILYVNLDSSPSSGLGDINEAASATFMAANQNLPTYDGTGFNLYLSVAPTIQRALCK
jgi:hypothetical protein